MRRLYDPSIFGKVRRMTEMSPGDESVLATYIQMVAAILFLWTVYLVLVSRYRCKRNRNNALKYIPLTVYPSPSENKKSIIKDSIDVNEPSRELGTSVPTDGTRIVRH